MITPRQLHSLRYMTEVERMTVREAARELGVDRVSAQNALVRARGIVRRDQSERMKGGAA